MVFDKNFWFQFSIIAFNIGLGFHGGVDYGSLVQFSAAGFLALIELNRQRILRKHRRITQRIAENTQRMEDAFALFHAHLALGMPIPADLWSTVFPSGLGDETEVNWKRDGF